MARSEYWSCPLRLPTPAAAHVAIASGVSQRVTSPRRHEGSVVLGPVPDAIRCLVLRMHSRLHIEIMTRRRSRWSTCRPLLAHRAESAHQRLGLQQAKQGGDDVPPLQGHPGLSDASEGTGVPESRGEVGVQDPEHHDGARDTRWRDDRMTGRRSHGRLSALNGVVHQGRSGLHRGSRAVTALENGLRQQRQATPRPALFPVFSASTKVQVPLGTPPMLHRRRRRTASIPSSRPMFGAMLK